MACEIENAGIPVVHVTNLTQISEGVGCSRILTVSYTHLDVYKRQIARCSKFHLDAVTANVPSVSTQIIKHRCR